MHQSGRRVRRVQSASVRPPDPSDGLRTGTAGLADAVEAPKRPLISQVAACPDLAPCRRRAGRLSWLQRAGPSATRDKCSSVVAGRVRLADERRNQSGVPTGRQTLASRPGRSLPTARMIPGADVPDVVTQSPLRGALTPPSSARRTTPRGSVPVLRRGAAGRAGRLEEGTRAIGELAGSNAGSVSIRVPTSLTVPGKGLGYEVLHRASHRRRGSGSTAPTTLDLIGSLNAGHDGTMDPRTHFPLRGPATRGSCGSRMMLPVDRVGADNGVTRLVGPGRRIGEEPRIGADDLDDLADLDRPHSFRELDDGSRAQQAGRVDDEVGAWERRCWALCGHDCDNSGGGSPADCRTLVRGITISRQDAWCVA